MTTICLTISSYTYQLDKQLSTAGLKGTNSIGSSGKSQAGKGSTKGNHKSSLDGKHLSNDLEVALTSRPVKGLPRICDADSSTSAQNGRDNLPAKAPVKGDNSLALLR